MFNLHLLSSFFYIKHNLFLNISTFTESIYDIPLLQLIVVEKNEQIGYLFGI